MLFCAMHIPNFDKNNEQKFIIKDWLIKLDTQKNCNIIIKQVRWCTCIHTAWRLQYIYNSYDMHY